MIRKAEELDFRGKKIKMILAGFAGIGKSTLGLSAPKPLLIDIDEGIDRVETPYRKDTMIVDNGYEGILKDFKENDFKDYETFVFDTGGKLLDIMKPYVIKQNAQNGQRDGSLSIKGWGAVAQEFKRFTDMIVEMKKHVIFIFHTKEEQDGDLTKLRIAIDGSMKTKIWEIMDLGGFVEMQGKQRVIGFSNTERYYAKGTHGIRGTYNIPELNAKENTPNTFLTDMFTKVIEDLQKDAEKFATEKEKYEEAMNMKVFIDSAQDLETINKILVRLVEMEHTLTSERELKTHLINKAKELGFSYDKEKQTFV